MWPFRHKKTATQLQRAFHAKFVGKQLIVHQGFQENWLAELMKQPGGAGYFRFDVRKPQEEKSNPLQWVVHEQLLPLNLPLPLFVQVAENHLLVRHLRRGERWFDPSEILWIIDELEQRHHARLSRSDDGYAVEIGLSPEQNKIESMFDGL